MDLWFHSIDQGVWFCTSTMLSLLLWLCSRTLNQVWSCSWQTFSVWGGFFLLFYSFIYFLLSRVRVFYAFIQIFKLNSQFLWIIYYNLGVTSLNGKITIFTVQTLSNSGHGLFQLLSPFISLFCVITFSLYKSFSFLIREILRIFYAILNCFISKFLSWYVCNLYIKGYWLLYVSFLPFTLLTILIRFRFLVGS